MEDDDDNGILTDIYFNNINNQLINIEHYGWNFFKTLNYFNM